MSPHSSNDASNIGTGKFGLLSPVSSPRQDLNQSSIYIETAPPPPNSQNPTDFHSHQRTHHYPNSFTPVTQNIPRTDSSPPMLPDRRSLPNRSSDNNIYYQEMDAKPVIDSSFEHNQLDRSSHFHHIPNNNDVPTPQFSNNERESIISRDSESRVRRLGSESDSTSVTRMSVNSLLC
ncbi:13215_t:CDS:1 [Racocetra persica]|uniref:13215_t:CDS:1 n=1 Tax=Racocetra persica TaxID=160502 RepID=A0ACA9R5A9_9GLOM|nr:13215_t:CDS:1 [Racocetra persica]